MQWIEDVVKQVVTKQNAQTREIAAAPEYQSPEAQRRLNALMDFRERAKPIFTHALADTVSGGAHQLPPQTPRELALRLRSRREEVKAKISKLHVDPRDPEFESDIQSVVIERTYDTALADAMREAYALHQPAQAAQVQR